MKTNLMYLVIYNKDNRLREREFSTLSQANEFSDSVNGSVCQVQKLKPLTTEQMKAMDSAQERINQTILNSIK